MRTPPASTPTHRLPTAAGEISGLSASTLGRVVWTLAFAFVVSFIPAPVHATRELPISRVVVKGDAVDDRAALVEVLGLAEGHPIDRQQLREAILAVYASGEVERIQVNATEAEDGVVVTVYASYRAKIAKIEVKTANLIRKNQIKKWIGLQLGDPASLSRIEAGQRRALRKLRERGYSQSELDVYVDYRRPSNTVGITVEPRIGEAIVVGSVVVTGIEDPEVTAAVTPRVKPNARLSARLQEKLRRQAEDQLRRRGFWEARVLDVDSSAGEVMKELVITVDAGPRYELQLTSPPETEKLVKEAFPDPVEEDIHPAQTEALAERIRENLQLKGYLLATVEAELVVDGPSHVIKVRADPNRSRKIATVDFPGANEVSLDLLRDTVRVKRGKTTGWWGGIPSATVLSKQTGYSWNKLTGPRVTPTSRWTSPSSRGPAKKRRGCCFHWKRDVSGCSPKSESRAFRWRRPVPWRRRDSPSKNQTPGTPWPSPPPSVNWRSSWLTTAIQRDRPARRSTPPSRESPP